MTTYIDRATFSKFCYRGEIPESIDRHFVGDVVPLCFVVADLCAFPKLVIKFLTLYPGDAEDHAAVRQRVRRYEEVPDSWMRRTVPMYRSWLARAAVDSVIKRTRAIA